MKKFKGTCLPMLMKSIMKLSQTKEHLEICNKSTNVGKHWLKLFSMGGQCSIPCQTFKYHGLTKKFDGWSEPRAATYYAYYVSNEIKVQEEYLVYGDVDLVGIVGGNLGLFIGFSFYDKIIQFIKIFVDLIN